MDKKQFEEQYSQRPNLVVVDEGKFDVTVNCRSHYLTVWAQRVGSLRKKIASITEFRFEHGAGNTFISATCEDEKCWMGNAGSPYVVNKVGERWNLYIICEMTGKAIPVYCHSGGATEVVFRYSHRNEKSRSPIRIENTVDVGDVSINAIEGLKNRIMLKQLEYMKGVMSKEENFIAPLAPSKPLPSAPEAISPMKILQDMVDKLNAQVAESLSVGEAVNPEYKFGSPCLPLPMTEKVITKSSAVGMSMPEFTPRHLENRCLLTTAAEFPGQLGLRAHFPNQRSEDE